MPCWVASDKLEYGARTIRPKITKKLEEYLTEFPPLIQHPYRCERKFKKVDWKNALKDVNIDMSVDEVTWAEPGYRAGIQQLDDFIHKRLELYSSKRNDPTADALSNLSPWYHFGMISVQRTILEVAGYKKKYKASVEAFMEEAIVRRELADNFCFYNDKYDTLEGANGWAIETLNKHRLRIFIHQFFLNQRYFICSLYCKEFCLEINA